MTTLRYDVTVDPPSEHVAAIERGLHAYNVSHLDAHVIYDCNAHLETAEFQALAFYLKHGYEVFGRLPGKPAGHTWYYLKKDLEIHLGQTSSATWSGQATKHQRERE